MHRVETLDGPIQVRWEEDAGVSMYGPLTDFVEFLRVPEGQRRMGTVRGSRTHGKIWILSTPRRQAGFFYNFWRDGNPKWSRIFSGVNDCPGIDQDYLEMQRKNDLIRYHQDFLREFIQPTDRLTDVETLHRMLLDDIDQ